MGVRVPLAQQDLLAQQGRQVRRVHKGPLVLKGQRVLPELRELLGLLALRDLQVRRAMMAPTAT